MTAKSRELRPRLAEADRLRSKGRYREAVEILQELWEMVPDDGVGSILISCLRKAGRTDEAAKVGREILERFPESRAVRKAFAWVLYERDIKPGPREEDESFLESAHRIIELAGKDLSARLTLFRVLKHLKNNGDWEEVIAWAGMFEKNDFPAKETNGGKKNAGEKRHAPPERLLWYYSFVKGLFTRGRHQEARDMALEALKDFPEDVHLARWAALSLGRLGWEEEAEREIELLCSKHPSDWFLMADRGDLLAAAGRPEEALDAYIAAALAPGEARMKVRIFQAAGELLMDLDRDKAAAGHLRLACAIRRLQGWSLPSQLRASLSLMGIDENEDFGDPEQHLRKCRSFWLEHRRTRLPERTGRIKAILSGGKAGFIESQGKDYYFKLSQFRGSAAEVEKGLEVFFLETTGFDPKKNRESLQAVDVRPSRAAQSLRSAEETGKFPF